MALDGDVEEGDPIEVRKHRVHLRGWDWEPAVVTEVRERLLMVRLADDSLLMIARGEHEWRPPVARFVAIETAAHALIEAIGSQGAGLGATTDAVKQATEALATACAKPTKS